ncbi:GntR family transcriptional regulator [Clostridium ljungdahlii]|uniref:HTH-type transcriptional regulator FrlR n=1 Tax=Clostridium ljungdahlii TaxID=1538 RepID=A0A162LCJ4_9CLOT|nr:GntR family transcriptional regulator [Clostridium ljungdahlii]OAA91766.1 HTH-type transcriptional regulator FrlR [Clostridium ljungdahlii]
MIDNYSIPKYVQLQNIIKQDIISGKYKNGDMIPSESNLMKKYCVTRTTIRKAISNLSNAGLVKQVQGKGTFVNLCDIKHNMWNFGGFTDYAINKYEIPVSKVLEKNIIVKDNEKFFKLVRARGIKKELGISWLTIDSSLIPLSIFRNIDKHDFSKESLYHVMKKEYKVFPKTASLELNSVIGDKKTKEILKYTQDIPLIKVTGFVYTEDNLKIEKLEIVYSPNMKMKIVTNINE